MSGEFISAAIFVVTTIFAAGGIVWTTRKELAQTKLDVNRVGQKIRDEGRLRHNANLIQIACENDRETRFKLATHFRED